jgi:hypothetical protein
MTTSIESALQNLAHSGDTVMVGPGQYHERFYLRPNIRVQGAGAGLSFIVIDDYAAVAGYPGVDLTGAVLDGFTIIYYGAPDLPARFAAMHFDLPHEKMTISNNVISSCVGTWKSGGIYVYAGAAPTIINNVFYGNSVTDGQGGGAIYVEDAAPIISGNTFIGNSAKNGGAIAVVSETLYKATITDNTFVGNIAQISGGAVYIENASPSISGNQIYSNTAMVGGGIRVTTGSHAVIEDNDIAFNKALGTDGKGGGVFVGDWSNPTLDRNIIRYNSAAEGGGVYEENGTAEITNNVLVGNDPAQILLRAASPHIANNTMVGTQRSDSIGIDLVASSKPRIANNIVAFHAYGIRGDGTALPTIRYNDLWMNSAAHYSGVTAEPNNLTVTPGLRDVANEDFHLQYTSALIDAGTMDDAPSFDFEGDARPIDGNGDGIAAPDIGADEYSTGSTTPRNIPLIGGWNLISYDIWPMSGGQVISNTAQVLQPIAGQYDVVLGYDPQQPQPGLTYDPLLPQFSTLLHLDPFHGYWIKAKNNATLGLQGTEVPVTTALPLSRGWNLISYLPNSSLPVADALASVSGKYSVVLGYDPREAQPGRTYDPLLPGFSTLLDLDPLFGYWIKMTQAGSLVYPTGSGLSYRSRVDRGVASQSEAGDPAALAAACGAGVHPSTEWVNFYSANSTLDSAPVPVGACVEAWVGSLKIGYYAVTTAGSYGFLAAYRDDSTTPGKDGAAPGDIVTFTINGYAATVAGGNPTWTSNGATIVAHLAAGAPVIDTPTPTPTHTPTQTVAPTPTPTPTATLVAVILRGTVALQRRVPAPDPSWIATLSVSFGGWQADATTDSSGVFTITDSRLTPGTYDICVKNSHALSTKTHVTLVAGTNPVYLGELLEGDASGDDFVDINDFGILAGAFMTTPVDERADFNQDEFVDIFDFAALRDSYFACGQCRCSSSPPEGLLSTTVRQE